MDTRDLKLAELKAVLAESRRLKEENAALRRLLVVNEITIPAPTKEDVAPAIGGEAQSTGVNEHSDKDAKIALFRSLFRGTEDVYAVRTRFKSGEWGYVPASIRDWKAVLSADAALRKKVDQKTRKLLPLTDDALRQHLEGRQTVGVYRHPYTEGWPPSDHLHAMRPGQVQHERPDDDRDAGRRLRTQISTARSKRRSGRTCWGLGESRRRFCRCCGRAGRRGSSTCHQK